MVDATIARISGPVAVAKDLEGAHMFDVVRIGEMGLMGEIIRLEGNTAQIQVYAVSYTHLTLPTSDLV